MIKSKLCNNDLSIIKALSNVTPRYWSSTHHSTGSRPITTSLSRFSNANKNNVINNIINTEARDSFTITHKLVTPRVRLPLSPISDKFRELMSSLSTPVMVLTTNQAIPVELDPAAMSETELESYGPRGMTLSSVCSLSMKPSPMVCFNLQVPSRTSAAIHSRKIFALNILPPNHDSVKICRAFAGGLGKDINPFKAEKEYLTTVGKDVSKLSDEFEISSENFIIEKASDIPTVKSAVAVMYCEAKEMFKVQDHEIWVAEIVAVRSSDRFLTPDCVGGVLYHKRAFHSVGERLKEPTVKEINDSRKRGRSKLSHCIEFTDKVIY